MLFRSLHHEIQHKIQFIEGFAAGSSTSHERDLARQKIVALKLKPADINILSSSYNGRRGLLVLEQLVNLQRNIDDEKLRRDLDRVINAHIDKLALFLGIHLYQRSAGEIESREIERRSIKPPEALKQTRPSFTEDFRKEEIIIRDQEGFPPGENGKILRTLRDRAMQMEKARIDNSIIFKQTGWYRDENGQWSFKMNSDLKKIIQKMKGKQ